jgi:hypothetical protein
MIVGTLRLALFIGESSSLKDRRRVVKSLKDRIRARFNVSVTDVGDQDLWQSAALGVAVVATDTRFAHEVLSKVAGLVESDPRVDILDRETRVS